ncbi:hypothetical protein QVA66_09755 [Staphylococcus chromogenes]|nr:hypothetical protein [Staphylococcus chromogenes]
MKKGGKMIALKGSSVAEELQRDEREIKKAGGGLAEIRLVGEEHLEDPTTLIIIARVK